MNIIQIAVLRSISMGVKTNLSAAVVKELQRLGFVYDDKGSAGLFVTTEGMDALRMLVGNQTTPSPRLGTH
jgi:hypothetical protein